MKVGDKVPDFELSSSNGQTFRLSHYKGQTVILYFYPKDSTPGCTLQGQEYNQLLGSFMKNNARIFGVSRDSVSSHCRFIETQGFEFELLSDPEEKACRLFGVMKEKNLYGKKAWGIERSAFVIGPNQKLLAEFRGVKAEGNAQTVLDSLKNY